MAATLARSPRLFCAIDTTDPVHARHMGQELIGIVDGLKLGLEFFTANGAAGLRQIKALGLPIFLDLKLHDIPNTVAGAMRAIAALGVAVTTVHASGGREMMQAALEAAREATPADGAPPEIVAVTVLTSLGDEDLPTIGQTGPVAEQVVRLAQLTVESGLAGIVSSARELALLRSRLGPDPLLVVPGLRPIWAAAQDQKRVVTPSDAVRLGADILVVGRPITGDRDPKSAARRIRAEIGGEAVVAAI
jgi:orotidine-5'-phosphate decarboxylase